MSQAAELPRGGKTYRWIVPQDQAAGKANRTDRRAKPFGRGRPHRVSADAPLRCETDEDNLRWPSTGHLGKQLSSRSVILTWSVMCADSLVLNPQLMDPREGLGWAFGLPATFGVGDTSAAPRCSTLLLLEDSRPLGPPHSVHEYVLWTGGGAYSHWHDTLYFSTSDGTDPRHNGRIYRAYPAWQPGLPQFEANSPRDQSLAGPLLRLSTRWDDDLNVILFLNRLGIYIRPEAKILDFGCGNGQHTFRMREIGFDCHGFDIHDSVNYRDAEDHKLFAFAERRGDGTDYTIDRDKYTIPFPDGFFDIVFSHSVLEHVQDLGAVMNECARVLKPTGVVVHCYPGKYQLIEPHIYIPFASFFSPAWWIRLWTRLGARNEFQRDRPLREATESNLHYARTGINYLGQREIRTVSEKYFTRVAIYSSKELLLSSAWGRMKATVKACFEPEPFRALGLTVLLKALVCEGKRPMPPSFDKTARAETIG